MSQNIVRIRCEDRQWKLRSSTFDKESDCFYHSGSDELESEWYDVLDDNKFELLIAPCNAEMIVNYLRGYHMNYASLGTTKIHNLYLDAERLGFTGLQDILSEIHVIPSITRRSDVMDMLEVVNEGLDLLYTIVPEIGTIIPEDALVGMISEIMTRPMTIQLLNDRSFFTYLTGAVVGYYLGSIGLVSSSAMFGLMNRIFTVDEFNTESLTQLILELFGPSSSTSNDNANNANTSNDNAGSDSDSDSDSEEEDIYQPQASVPAQINVHSFSSNADGVINMINNIVESMMIQAPNNEDFISQTVTLLNSLDNADTNDDESNDNTGLF